MSDAHLLNEGDEGYRRLIRFFKGFRGEVSHLIIAGDLFDFWFCDKQNLYPEFRTMFETLLQLQQEGVAVSLIEGNHDFFLDQAFRGYGIGIFQDEVILDLDGKKIYVAHGDRVDRSNRFYLVFRRFLRSDFFFATQKRIPASILWRIARISSHSSRKYQKRPDSLLCEMNNFAAKKISNGVDAVILGHSHRPVLTEVESGERAGILALLGDWIEHYSYVSLESGHFSLQYFENGGK